MRDDIIPDFGFDKSIEWTNCVNIWKERGNVTKNWTLEVIKGVKYDP